MNGRRMLAGIILIGASLGGVAAWAATSDDSSPTMGEAQIMKQQQKVVVITGSTDGLGREVATRVAATGAHVIVHGRNQERGAEVVRAIEAAGGSASFYAADFADLAQVRALAEAIDRDYDRIDVLVNNAGIWLRTGERQVNAAGHEMHFAVNYLAGYLLTRSLLPLIEAAAPSRIINIASVAQNPIDFSNPMLERGYNGGRGYGQSKLAQIIFTMDLAEELRDRDVTVVAVHPSTLMDTNMVSEAGLSAQSTVDEGADAVMNLVTGTDIETGQYYDTMRPTRANDQAYDFDAQAALRELSERLTASE